MRRPTNNPITLSFGATTAPYSPSSPHNGTDFSYLPDDIIYAPFSGKVVQLPNNGNDGNGSYMTESNGRFHGMLHASKYLVANGSQVTEGQPIAVMGDTGYAIGKHLHWAVKENNKFIDPMTLIKKEGIVEPADYKLNKGDAVNMFQAILGRPATDADIKYYTGRVWKDAVYDLVNSPEFKGRFASDAAQKLEQIKQIVG